MYHIFTPEEIFAWDYDFRINGNQAADLMAYWTPEMSTIIANATIAKIPIKVDDIRRSMKLFSPYSRDPAQPWLHPDEATGQSYIYQAIEAIA